VSCPRSQAQRSHPFALFKRAPQQPIEVELDRLLILIQKMFLRDEREQSIRSGFFIGQWCGDVENPLSLQCTMNRVESCPDCSVFANDFLRAGIGCPEPKATMRNSTLPCSGQIGVRLLMLPLSHL